jgi:hypothetical protein
LNNFNLTATAGKRLKNRYGGEAIKKPLRRVKINKRLIISPATGDKDIFINFCVAGEMVV